MHLHPIPAQFSLHEIKASVELNIGEGPVDGTFHGVHERFNHATHVDLTDDRKAFLITFFRSLPGFGVNVFMVTDGQPCGKSAVEFIEAKDIAGAHFGFQLILDSLKKPFDSAACRRVPGWPMQQLDVRPVAGGFQAV